MRLSFLNTSLIRLKGISWRACAAIVCDWALIVVCISGAIYFDSWWAYILAVPIIARTQLALAVMMHESAHGLLAKSRKMNDLLGQFFCAGPLFLSMLTYRSGHLKHHRNPMAADDPVACVFDIHGYPISRLALTKKIFFDLLTLTYWLNVIKTVRGDFKEVLPTLEKKLKIKAFEFTSVVLTNSLIFGLLLLNGNGLSYFWLWLFPALTVLPILGRIRAIMEHAAYPQAEDQSTNARTIIHRNWQTFWFGPHNIHYHIEHHLHPIAQFHTLPTIHKNLKRRGLLPNKNLYTSYWKIIKEVTF